MDTRPTPQQVVAKLAEFWRFHKTQQFSAYLHDNFGVTPTARADFDCICIAQIENGDVRKGEIGGLLVQWWVVDDDGIRSSSNTSLPTLLNDPENLQSGFYPRPVVKFFLDGTHAAIGESFGPSYVCRKIARIIVLPDGDIDFVDQKIIWNTSSLSQ